MIVVFPHVFHDPALLCFSGDSTFFSFTTSRKSHPSSFIFLQQLPLRPRVIPDSPAHNGESFSSSRTNGCSVSLYVSRPGFFRLPPTTPSNPLAKLFQLDSLLFKDSSTSSSDSLSQTCISSAQPICNGETLSSSRTDGCDMFPLSQCICSCQSCCDHLQHSFSSSTLSPWS